MLKPKESAASRRTAPAVGVPFRREFRAPHSPPSKQLQRLIGQPHRGAGQHPQVIPPHCPGPATAIRNGPTALTRRRPSADQCHRPGTSRRPVRRAACEQPRTLRPRHGPRRAGRAPEPSSPVGRGRSSRVAPRSRTRVPGLPRRARTGPPCRWRAGGHTGSSRRAGGVREIGERQDIATMGRWAPVPIASLEERRRPAARRADCDERSECEPTAPPRPPEWHDRLQPVAELLVSACLLACRQQTKLAPARLPAPRKEAPWLATRKHHARRPRGDHAGGRREDDSSGHQAAGRRQDSGQAGARGGQAGGPREDDPSGHQAGGRRQDSGQDCPAGHGTRSRAEAARRATGTRSRAKTARRAAGTSSPAKTARRATAKTAPRATRPISEPVEVKGALKQWTETGRKVTEDTLELYVKTVDQLADAEVKAASPTR